ncbi:MAG TPA: glycosyltransferase family 9 protein [Nitrospiraceae bacterium]|nr:glycosyltransferase family 9 protein [Nitrospiraceae bacterium]
MAPDVTVHRLLLIKPSSLGDIVHALPTLAVLRNHFPQASVTWAVKRQWAGLVERVEGVDHILALDNGVGGWLSKVPLLRAGRFDLVVDLQGLFRSGLMVWLSGSRRRVGLATAREGSPLFYTQRVPVPTPHMHAVDRYLLVAAALGASPPAVPAFRFRQDDGDVRTVQQLLQREQVSPARPWVAMNVSARWPTKRWQAESFARTADLLADEGLGPVVFIGGRSEQEDAAHVRSLMRTQAVDLVGQTEVGLLPTLLRQAAALVTNDSGPMHIAAAVGTPVVALFGPTDPIRTGPYGGDHAVLTHDVACRPCLSRRCHHSVHLACLSGVTPEQVLQAVRARVTYNLTASSG